MGIEKEPLADELSEARIGSWREVSVGCHFNGRLRGGLDAYPPADGEGGQRGRVPEVHVGDDRKIAQFLLAANHGRQLFVCGAAGLLIAPDHDCTHLRYPRLM